MQIQTQRTLNKLKQLVGVYISYVSCFSSNLYADHKHDIIIHTIFIYISKIIMAWRSTVLFQCMYVFIKNMQKYTKMKHIILPPHFLMHAKVFVWFFLQFSTHSYLMMIIFNLFFLMQYWRKFSNKTKKGKRLNKTNFMLFFWFVYLLMALAYLFDDFVVIFLRTKKKILCFRRYTLF